MRSWGLLAALATAVACSSWLDQVEAAACAEICYTTDLTGFGPGGTAGCSCTGSGATRSGTGGCSCGQCYEETNGAVIGYAINTDGTCTYGTDCGDCTYSSDSSSSASTASSSSASSASSTTSAPSSTSTTGSSRSTTTATDAPTTTSPAATSGTSSASTASPTSDNSTSSSSTTTTAPSSSGSSGNAGSTSSAGSGATSTSSDKGLKTWQIALIICCGVLVFTVAVVSVLSCYCKARNRLYENEEDQADSSYYQQQYPRQRPDVVGSGSVATPTLFPQGPTSTRNHARTGSSGSFTNELKPMYANSTNSSSTDRLALGLAPVHTRNSSGDVASNYPNVRNSSGDLVGMGNNYSNDRILSGSYPTDRRPSSSNRSIGRRPSLEQGYASTRDRDSLAVEL